MSDNTIIETQPIVEQPKVGLETPVVTEIPRIEIPNNNPDTQVPLATETPVEIPEESISIEVVKETPTPSAGFPIKEGASGASRILLEKLIGAVANL